MVDVHIYAAQIGANHFAKFIVADNAHHRYVGAQQSQVFRHVARNAAYVDVGMPGYIAMPRQIANTLRLDVHGDGADDNDVGWVACIHSQLNYTTNQLMPKWAFDISLCFLDNGRKSIPERKGCHLVELIQKSKINPALVVRLLG